MKHRLTGHLRGNAVAYVALFLAVGGTSAWAAGQITGTQIKDGSITGADVLNESVEGRDVDESSLAAVPSAAKAGDAETLDGRDSSDFLQATTKVADADKLDGTVDSTVAEREEFISLRPVREPVRETVTVTCPDDGIAVRGSHAEQLTTDVGVLPPTYDRSSYSVTYDSAQEVSGRVVLKLRCLTGTAP